MVTWEAPTSCPRMTQTITAATWFLFFSSTGLIRIIYHCQSVSRGMIQYDHKHNIAFVGRTGVCLGRINQKLVSFSYSLVRLIRRVVL